MTDNHLVGVRPAANHRWRGGRIARVITTGLVLATVAACGSSSPAKHMPSTHPHASGSASTASGGIPNLKPIPQVVALVPKAIKDKGSVTVAADATYPPDEFIGPDGHTIVGMDADLGRALGQVMGVHWKLVNASFDTIIPGLQSGKYDIGLSSFTDTKARQKVVNFVTYFKAGEAFYVKSGAPGVTSLSALCGKTVSVESGTTEQAAATAQSKTCTTAHKAAVHVQVYGNQNEANLAVSSGRADAGFADSQVAAYIVKLSHGVFKLSGQPIAVAPYGIAIPKHNGMTIPTLAAMKALIANGTYARILAKWGVQNGAISNPVINGAIS